MTAATMSLPRDIPWKLLAVSPDMMDTDFCDKTFPFRWRSSLAISAFEPTLDDLPEGMCEERVTFLRITSSITGYQPTKAETDQGYVSFPDLPTEELNWIIGEYFACYGAQLNIAVFPGPNSKRVEFRERVEVTFADDVVGSLLDNPLVRSDFQFEQPGERSLEVVDQSPPGGDGQGELNLRRELVITVPDTDRVEAVVCHAAAPVKMEAFSNGASVGLVESGPEQDQTHSLSIDGDGIDEVVFTAEENEASLLGIAYWATRHRDATLADYPHIVDFEPKTRDLYQAASETGEILTASVSAIATDKTLTHTETSETGLSLGAKYSSPETPYGKAEVSGSWSHKWGETDNDVRQIGADASRERRERQGSTTNLSQLYNLLTGYHAGTNRAVFLMLPRPHILQPTDRRTFIQGLRTIEGIQEYFLLVTRPKYSAGMCIEVALETGHFPEDVTTTEPEVEYEESSETFDVSAYAKGGGGITGQGAETKDLESFASSTYTISQGWVVDKRAGKGDPGHPGVEEVANNSNGRANDTLRNYNYQANSDTSVQVSGRIEGKNWWGEGAVFERSYKVLTRSEQPKETTEEPEVTTPFLITARKLCACFRSTDSCPEVVEPRRRPDFTHGDWLVDEAVLQVVTRSSARGVGRLRQPAVRETLRQIQHAMARSSRMPSRRPMGQVNFLTSDYFAKKIAQYIPDAVADEEVTDEGQNVRLTVKELMERGLVDLERTTHLPAESLARMRSLAYEVLGGVAGERTVDDAPSN